MTQTGVLKVQKPDGSWGYVGYPALGGGTFKVFDGETWHYADNNAAVRTGRLKIMNAAGAWQHVSWMRGPHVPIDTLVVRGSNRLDLGVNPAVTDYSLALPAATQIGDMLVLSAHPGQWAVYDPRLTDYGLGAYVGRATDLSPITLRNNGSWFVTAQLVVLVNPDGGVAGTNAITTTSDLFPAPVVPGVKAAVACASGSFATVAGYVQPNEPGWLFYGTTGYHSSTVSVWDDPAATSSPPTQFYGNGGSGVRYLTVIGLA